MSNSSKNSIVKLDKNLQATIHSLKNISITPYTAQLMEHLPSIHHKGTTGLSHNPQFLSKFINSVEVDSLTHEKAQTLLRMNTFFSLIKAGIKPSPAKHVAVHHYPMKKNNTRLVD